jgi:ATP-binding cassette subfamily B protein
MWSYLRYDEEQDRPKVDRHLLRRVLSYASAYRAKILLILVTIVLISFISALPPLLIRELLDNAIPEAKVTGDLGQVTLLGLGMLLVPLVNGGIGVLQRWASASTGEGIIFDLRRQLFGHFQRMSLGFFTATRTGEVMSRLNNDVVGAQQAVTGTFITVVSNVVSVAIVMSIMFGIEWRLTLLAVAVLPFFLATSRRVGKVLRVIRREQLEHNARMNSHMQEALGVSGALLVKLFGRAGAEDAKFAEEAGVVRDLGVRQATIGRWYFMALGVMSAVGTALVFWVGAAMVVNGTLEEGDVVAMSLYLTQLYGPLSGLSNARVEFATSLVSFERVFEVLDLEHEIDEIDDPVALDDIAGRVTFENVSFDYSRSSQGLEAVRRYSSRMELDPDLPHVAADGLALRGVDFDVAPGELVALVGPSGAGKTTTTYLVPRLYDATDGRVLIDGVDVRRVRMDDLASGIGVVTQEAYLFHDSIEANLRYAKPNATIEELRGAAADANILDFIDSLPEGFGTKVGERGYRLSGGEKQRLALARVILKDPRILILDEATAHLDAQSEALIQDALERVMAGRTSLVIAHRLSTILSADRILVLDGGRLIESGTHGELLARGGLYAELYRTQFRVSEEETAITP